LIAGHFWPKELKCIIQKQVSNWQKARVAQLVELRKKITNLCTIKSTSLTIIPIAFFMEYGRTVQDKKTPGYAKFSILKKEKS
jgi:invasion protein IalB